MTTKSLPICLFLSTCCESLGVKGNIVETWNIIWRRGEERRRREEKRKEEKKELDKKQHYHEDKYYNNVITNLIFISIGSKIRVFSSCIILHIQPSSKIYKNINKITN